MGAGTPRHPITLKKLVYDMPGTDAVIIRHDVPYRDDDGVPLGMDFYYPPDANDGATRPAVVFIFGFPEAGARTSQLGCTFKEMECYIGWAKLVAASGMIAVTYENRVPVADASAVLQHLRQNARSLGIDARRIGICAFSGNGPVGLSVVMREAIACAVLLCAYSMDLDEATGVADASAHWRFVNACAGKAVEDLPRTVPMFIARAGRDEMVNVNTALDRFIVTALGLNLPITVANHPHGPHAFDLFDDSVTTKAIIGGILAFLRGHLTLEGTGVGREGTGVA